jgi:hypothetical protein
MINMKKIIFSLSMLFALVANIQAQQTFDVFTYTAPKGFTKTAANDKVAYTLTKKDATCTITLFAATSTSGTMQNDFNAAWKNNVENTLGKSDTIISAAMGEIDGWEMMLGTGTYIKGTDFTMAMLNSYTGFGKSANISIVSSGDGFENITGDFLASLSLKGNAANTSTDVTTPIEMPNVNTGKTETTTAEVVSEENITPSKQLPAKNSNKPTAKKLDKKTSAKKKSKKLN